MKRNFFLAAALFACAAAAGFALREKTPEEPLSSGIPRDVIEPFEPPSQSIPRPLPGQPAPLPAIPNEGTARPVPPLSDEDLIRGLKAALGGSSAPAVKRLTIDVVDGKATLRGAVRSQEEKDIVTAKAGVVAGPRNVINNITVEP